MSEAPSTNMTDRAGGYKPKRIAGAKHPLFQWPPRLSQIAKFIFGFPGYLWSWPCLFLSIATLWWLLLPDALVLRHFSLEWIAPLLLGNLLLVVLFTGGLQMRLYRAVNLIPLDRWLRTFHDGSDEADRALRERTRADRSNPV
jgi:hypothetical protein